MATAEVDGGDDRAAARSVVAVIDLEPIRSTP
jgi:hypothetical protein